MKQNVITSRNHSVTVWLNFTRGSDTTLVELEALCAELRSVGAQDAQSVEFSRELSPRLTAVVQLPLPEATL